VAFNILPQCPLSSIKYLYINNKFNWNKDGLGLRKGLRLGLGLRLEHIYIRVPNAIKCGIELVINKSTG
jgi:hypothetical protein